MTARPMGNRSAPRHRPRLARSSCRDRDVGHLGGQPGPHPPAGRTLDRRQRRSRGGSRQEPAGVRCPEMGRGAGSRLDSSVVASIQKHRLTGETSEIMFAPYPWRRRCGIEAIDHLHSPRANNAAFHTMTSGTQATGAVQHRLAVARGYRRLSYRTQLPQSHAHLGSLSERNSVQRGQPTPCRQAVPAKRARRRGASV